MKNKITGKNPNICLSKTEELKAMEGELVVDYDKGEIYVNNTTEYEGLVKILEYLPDYANEINQSSVNSSDNTSYPVLDTGLNTPSNDIIIDNGFVYGIDIDLNESDPYHCITYTDDCRDFANMEYDENNKINYGSWQYIIKNFGIKPCIVKNGAVACYLNPNDYTKDVNGNTVNITDPATGDVMIEFNKLWYKFTEYNGIISFRISNYRPDYTFRSDAFVTNSGTGISIKDKIYVSAYQGYKYSERMCSTSGATPSSFPKGELDSFYNNTITGFIKGYKPVTYSIFLYLLFLSFLLFKKINIKDILGDPVTESTKTGLGDKLGLFVLSTDTVRVNKIFGIENLFNSVGTYLCGISVNQLGKLEYQRCFNDTIITDDIEIPPTKFGYIDKLHFKCNNSIIAIKGITGDCVNSTNIAMLLDMTAGSSNYTMISAANTIQKDYCLIVNNKTSYGSRLIYCY